MRYSPAFTLVALLLTIASAFAQDLPPHSGAINDFANVLSDQTESSLTTIVESLEKDTTAEIAVATVSALDGTTVDDYAVRLFKAWGIGQRGRDNGVLILVAPGEREIRIEVGYGLEGVLPDGLAGVVIRETFLPRFREGDYDGGVLQGVERLAGIVRRNETLTPEQLRALEQSGSDWLVPFIFVPFLGLFVALGMGILGAGLRHADRFFLIFGSAFGGIPLLLSPGFGLYGFLILLALAVVAATLGYFKGEALVGRLTRRSSPGTPGARGDGSSRSSSSGSSSWSSGSSSSSSSSSSFGGGRSGGGGASGKW